MKTMRERVVAELSHVIDELTGLERIHHTHDDVAVDDIHAAKQPVISLRDRYAAADPTPLDPRAAQEVVALAALLDWRGKGSTSPVAKRDLEHSAGRLRFFVTRAGVMLGLDGEQFLSR